VCNRLEGFQSWLVNKLSESPVLPRFSGILCHDYWKPYYRYDCTHALCNAHHLRELEWVWEQDKQQWAKQMQGLLCEINAAVHDAGSVLAAEGMRRIQKTIPQVVIGSGC